MANKLAQLILTPGKNSGSTCDIFVAQPDSIKKSLAGKLFILIEIESRKTESLKIINFLIDNINHNYYQNEKILLREKVEFLKVEHIFESVLSKVNKNFAEYLKNEKIKTDFRFINVTVGIIHDDMFYFSNAGKNKVFFIYKEKVTENKKRGESNDSKRQYKIIDIAKQTKTDINKKSASHTEEKNKLFSDVVSGKIPEKGYFAITNEALPEYISNKQLMQILTSLPPVSAVEQIKNLLSNINSYVPFLAVIIKNTTLERLEVREVSEAPLQDSLYNLNKTEEDTENLLTPPGIISFKKWLKFPSALLSKKEKINSQQNSRQIILKDKIFTKKRTLKFLSINKIGDFIKNILLFSVYIVSSIPKIIFRDKKEPSILPDERENTNNKIRAFISSLKNLNKKNKILLAVSVFCLAIFLINILVMGVKKERERQTETYNQLVATIDQKQNQIEANLLYNNEDNAKKIIEEISELMESFPQNTKEQKNQYSQFNEKVNGYLEKLRRVTRIDNLTELANFVNLNSGASPENIVLIPEKNKIYAADSGQKSIYMLDTTDKTITTLTDMEESLSSLRFPAVTKNNSIYYLGADNIIEFNFEEESFQNIDIDLKNISEEYVAAGTYNNNLYLLHPQSNQIEKYSKSGQNFSPPTLWIKDNLNLSEAADISIDGQIYVLEKNGQILKLLKGEKQELNLEQPDPAVEQAEKIFISSELKFVYILEPEKNRLILFDKTGKFLMQYKFDDLNNLKDFAVDEKNSIIYLLNNTSVFSTEAQHLEM